VRKRALKAKIAGYLAKPVQSRELIACIRVALEAWQAEQAAPRNDAAKIGDA
jgi:DNA-binding response OmpR family regulator